MKNLKNNIYTKRINVKQGDKFGYWEVINPNFETKDSQRYALCRCQCGKEQSIIISRLLRGEATKCRSCAMRERGRKNEIKIGNKYKHWTILEGPTWKPSSNGNTAWYKVQCDCGKIEEKVPADLLHPTRNAQCQDCAQKERAFNTTLENGRIGDLTKTRFTYLKNSAKKRDLEFSVSMEYIWNLYINQNKICAITGDPIQNFNEASLDRIDSSKGYIEGNVQWVTRQANLSKHIMSMTELYDFCKKVLNYANQKPSISLTTNEGSETNS